MKIRWQKRVVLSEMCLGLLTRLPLGWSDENCGAALNHLREFEVFSVLRC